MFSYLLIINLLASIGKKKESAKIVFLVESFLVKSEKCLSAEFWK